MLVVDDHEFVRAAVVAMLERAPDMVVCAQAAGIAEAEEVAAMTNPDVVVIDLHLGDATSTNKLVIFGDSHIEMWMPAILAMARHDGWAVVPLVKACWVQRSSSTWQIAT